MMIDFLMCIKFVTIPRNKHSILALDRYLADANAVGWISVQLQYAGLLRTVGPLLLKA